MSSNPGPSSSSAPAPNAKLEWFLLHVGFIVIGVITNMLATTLPQFTKQWQLSDAQGGFFFTSQYFTSLFGVIASSWLIVRYSSSKVLSAAFLFLSLGMAFLGVSPWLLSALCVAVNGFGYGLSNPTANLRATQLPSKNVASAVSLLNFSWSVGAVASPRLVALFGIRGLSIGTAVVCGIICIAHFFNRSSVPRVAPKKTKRAPSDWMFQLKKRPALPLLALFFLYVGTEVSIGGWVAATLAKRVPDASASMLANAPFAFYGLLLIGRGFAPFILRRISTVRFSTIGFLLAGIGTAMIIFSHSSATLLFGAGLAGFGCAPQYPVLVTWLAQNFHEDADWLGALFFSFGSLGGAFLPWIVGIVAGQTHSLTMGFLIPLATCFLMLLLALRAHPPNPSIPQPV